MTARPRRPTRWLVDHRSPLTWQGTGLRVTVHEVLERHAWSQRRSWGMRLYRVRTAAHVVLIVPGAALGVMHLAGADTSLPLAAVPLQVLALLVAVFTGMGERSLGLDWQDSMVNVAQRLQVSSIPAHQARAWLDSAPVSQAEALLRERYRAWERDLPLDADTRAVYAGLLGEWHGSIGELAAAVRVL